jgi:YhcH/YjgK/YiaL family protein
MIHDHISNAERYTVLHPRLAAALRYVADFDPSTADGDYLLDGDDVLARPHRYESKPEAERRWETHRRYVDVQYIVSGRERILHTHVDRLTGATEYEAVKDVVHYAAADGKVNDLVLHAGDFVIFFQHDGHKPSIALDGPEPVRKIVVKVDLGT